MTADQTNPRTTDKKKTGWKRLLWSALKVFLLLFLFNIAYTIGAAVPLSMSYFNDYCYLNRLTGPSIKETYKQDIERIKSEKLPGWEERVKIKEEGLSKLTKDESLFFQLLDSLCGDLNKYSKFELFLGEGARALEESANQ